MITSKRKDKNDERALYAVRYPTKECQDYKKLVKDTLLELRAWHRSGSRVAYRLLVCPANKGRTDISNRIKILEDALKDGGLYLDDEQVDEAWIRRGPIVAGGVVRISLWEVIPDYNANLRWVEG